MAKSARSFQYTRRSVDDIKERANARGGGYDDYIKPQYKKYKVRDGKNLIRVLPPTWENARHYGYDVYINYGIGADNQAYLSLSKMKNEKDPLAEARREAEQEGNEKVAKALKPNQRILIWVIDRQDEAEGPQLWAAPFTFDKALANISMDEDTKEITLIDDPSDGCDVRFYKEGTGLLTKYDASKMKLIAAPLSEDEKQENEWLDFITVNPLPDVLNFYDYDHISSVFNGNVRTDDDDTETAKRPLQRRMVDEDQPASKAKQGGKDSPPWDDEEETPRRSRLKAVDPDNGEDPPDEPKGVGQSIRERLQRSRAAKKPAEDDND